MNSKSSSQIQPEIVLGIVAAVGTDLRAFEELLEDQLKRFRYELNLIRLSSALKDSTISKHLNIKVIESTEVVRLNTAMDAGNKVRELTGSITNRYDLLARWAMLSINSLRQQKQRRSQTDIRGRAHVLHSLKHPDEVSILRSTYGPGFFLIGVYCDANQRHAYLMRKGASDIEATTLIERDQNEKDPCGQKTRDTFQLADVFVELDINNQDGTVKAIERFLDLVFGNPFITPTPDEHAMFLACASSLRSGSLARQVGAVITSANGEIIATGANDTPCKGGGLYGPGDSDQRDYVKGFDSNTLRRDEIIVDIMRRVKGVQANALDGEISKNLLSEGLTLFAGSALLDITEFGRDVHAEMEALMSCARVGISARGGTLYTTTFPCHNCAKHIIAAGIDRVVYIEPYPKSLAAALYEDAISIGKISAEAKADKVRFEPFVGIGPRKYFDLFSISLSTGRPLERKSKDGTKVAWNKLEAVPRMRMLPTSFIEREQMSVSNLDKLIKEVASRWQNNQETNNTKEAFGTMLYKPRRRSRVGLSGKKRAGT